jgi:hypothetical protein
MRQLENTPIFERHFINSARSRTRHIRSQSVDLIMNNISVVDMAAIREGARHHMQLSVAYVARTVRIDSDVEITDSTPAGRAPVK